MLWAGSGGSDDVFIVPVEAPVTVEMGQQAQVELLAERGTALNILVVSRRSEPPPATVIVTDAAGTEVLRRSVYWNAPRPGETESAGYVSLMGRPGDLYALTVLCEGEVVAEQEFSMPAGVNIGPDVRIVLP
jgi:hypothetical protein